jgi:amino acid efflux transporter
VIVLSALVAGLASPGSLVRATSACFVLVYIAATASAVKILRGKSRVAAGASSALTLIVAAFSGWYLVVPIASCFGFGLVRARHGSWSSGSARHRRLFRQ